MVCEPDSKSDDGSMRVHLIHSIRVCFQQMVGRTLPILALSGLILGLGAGCASRSDAPHPAGGRSYTNPVYAGSMPDPSVIRHQDAYYAFGTTGGSRLPDGRIFTLLRSRNLVDWEPLGVTAWTAWWRTIRSGRSPARATPPARSTACPATCGDRGITRSSPARTAARNTLSITLGIPA